MPADVAELADAQDLKSCDLNSRTGSIPVIGIFVKIRFKVHYVLAQIAQSVEQRTEYPRVGSSILSLGTSTKISYA